MYPSRPDPQDQMETSTLHWARNFSYVERGYSSKMSHFDVWLATAISVSNTNCFLDFFSFSVLVLAILSVSFLEEDRKPGPPL